ncbi:GNAT family N-acetyltransferase [Alteromonas aestuariivivens]|uniref:GNAT family N-acetyltransferase n=1 Tax=Alteromonas aestuariivivens TaxID=1938339 RepID=A0A3D8MGU7_9ALTE|nr:GNAT family N-acetyltransferase [Alteromonas aestuariivivens]
MAWNAYVAADPLATPYHRFEWQRAVNQAYGHPIAGLMALSKSTNAVVGVLPAIQMNIPFAGRKICALPYCDAGYGLADSPEILAAMRNGLIEFNQRQSGKYVEIRDVTQTPMDSGAMQGQKVRMLLTLPESSEALLASFKSKLRSQIRKAEKNGLTVSLGTQSEFIEAFYQVYARNMRDLGSPVHKQAWFEQIIRHYGDNALISVVYKGEHPAGAGLILKNGSSACIPWASTLREYNPLAPNMLLYWSLLEHCADNGIRLFDFGRSTYEEGTYRFKKQWGAEPQLLLWKKFNHQAQPLADSGRESGSGSLRAMVENTWRKLPLGFTIKAGALIRPYISL